jgi:hypothetical protein
MAGILKKVKLGVDLMLKSKLEVLIFIFNQMLD